MDLKIGNITFDAQPTIHWEFPPLMFATFERMRTKRVKNFYDCRDGGTFGKKKTLTMRGNVILLVYATTQNWPEPLVPREDISPEQIKDTAFGSLALFEQMKKETGLTSGDALDAMLEKMFGATPKMDIPYDAIVAAHPGYALEMKSSMVYQFIELKHPKLSAFPSGRIAIAIPAGTETWVGYMGKCAEEGYTKFKGEKRLMFRDLVFMTKPPATDAEKRTREMLLDKEIEGQKRVEEAARERREMFERRKAALSGG